ncbi:hypothetical protein BT69DRAFT_601630 [Atractiella rhizophila]|nr:hypothetical protein BT69DRAFT_1325023 [Atractiella rhizophila]KAH8918111.1 hypothetical protein BT69DRAFT_601630 [Atractiella rhizophila]
MTPHSAPPVPLSQAQPNHPHAQAQPHRQQSHSQAVRQPPPQPNPQPPFHSRTEPAAQALQSQLKPSMTPQSNPQPQIPPHSQPAPSTIRHLPPTPEAVAPRPATQPIPSPYPDQFTAPSQARPMVVNAVTMPPPQGMAYPVPSQVLQQPTPSATGQVAKNHEYHDLSSPSVGGYPYFPPHMHATHATPPIQVRTRADSNAWAGQGQGSGQPATTPATGGASSATVSYRSAPVSEYQQQSAGAGGPRPSVDSYPYPSHHQVAGRPPLPEL